jgi:hypothetical protein
VPVGGLVEGLTLKVVFEEPESAALDDWLSARSELPVVTGERAKVVRMCRRMKADAPPEAGRLPDDPR